MKKYDYIDCLRGIAISWVILAHVFIGFSFKISVSYFFAQLAANGIHGVQLFFVVSAFTLCLSYDQRSQSEKNPLLNFFIRRFFRIAPMFYLMIFFYSIIYQNNYSTIFLLSNIFFFFSFHPFGNCSMIPFGWTIGTEMVFYVLFPLFYKIMKDVKDALWTIGICLLVAIAMNHMLIDNLEFINSFYKIDKSALEIFSYRLIIYQLPVFLMGIFTYLIVKDDQYQFIPLPKLLLFISMLLLSEIIFSFGIQKLYMFASIFVLWIIMLFKQPYKLFVNVILKEIGKVSFSMYLLHNFVMTSLKSFCPSVLNNNIYMTFLIIMIASYAISKISYEIFEKNFIFAGKKVIEYLETK